MGTEIRPLDRDELEAAHDVRAVSMARAPAPWDPDRPSVPGDRVLGAVSDGRVVATTSTWPLAQRFGGRPVPMGGVAGVATAPLHRGRGLATRLLERALARMRQAGEVIATLYPATITPYRRLGWELAGVRVRRRVPTGDLRRLPTAARAVALRDGDLDADLETLREVEAAAHRHHPGTLQRSEVFWRRLAADDRRLVVAERGGAVRGYAVWDRDDPPADSPGMRSYTTVVHDLTALDADAGLALWRLLGSNDSVSPELRWASRPADPLLWWLPEPRQRVVTDDLHWMTRLVDAPAAVAARGYPPGAEVAVALRVRDPVVDANDGTFVLEVADGRARLDPGGDGDVELGVGALAALYTGFADPADLAAAGRLDAHDRDDVAALRAAFAGPLPWCRDFF